MSIGIGLGAFMGSFSQGYGMGKQMQADWDENKQKKEMQGIYDRNRKQFEEGVQAGQFNVGDWDKYATEHMYPELVGIHEKRGDYKTAFALKEYLGSQAGIEHGRNFANGWFQYSIGDYHGAAETTNKILKKNGLKDISVTPLDGGRMLIAMPGADGKTVSQDMSREEFGKIYNEKLNPEYAGLWHAAQKNKAAANAPGLNGANDNPAIDYDTAFKRAQELAPPDASMEDIEKMAWKIHNGSRPSRNPQLGIGISQGGQTLIDTRTGQPVSAPAQQQPQPQQMPAGDQQPSAASGATNTPIDALVQSDAPKTKEELMKWAQAAKQAGLSNEAIASGWHAITIADKGELPKEFAGEANGQASPHEIEQAYASLGITDRGRKIKEHQQGTYNEQVRTTKSNEQKQLAVKKIESAFKEGRIAREGLYQLMEREGVAVEDLPQYMQPVMRDAKPGIWGRTKQVFGIKAYDDKDRDVVSEPVENLIKQHNEIEYKGEKARSQHKREKEIIGKVQSGEVKADTIEISMNYVESPYYGYSKEFKDIIRKMARNEGNGNKESNAIGIGERKIPTPKQKPKVTSRQDGWLYDEKGHPIGQNPNHPNPSPVPDYAGYAGR